MLLHCSACGLDKEETEFDYRSGPSGGRDYWCATCRKRISVGTGSHGPRKRRPSSSPTGEVEREEELGAEVRQAVEEMLRARPR
jgi:hypothetical protein